MVDESPSRIIVGDFFSFLGTNLRRGSPLSHILPFNFPLFFSLMILSELSDFFAYVPIWGIQGRHRSAPPYPPPIFFDHYGYLPIAKHLVAPFERYFLVWSCSLMYGVRIRYLRKDGVHRNTIQVLGCRRFILHLHTK